MQMDDMILVSIDDHMIEPPDMYENHVPAKWKDQVPEGRAQRRRASTSGCSRARATSTPFGMAATVGLARARSGASTRARYSELRPGCFDVHERVRDMDANGVLASMSFPTMAGFNARTFTEAGDKELALVMLQAYNDWAIDEWCGAYPGRFIPLGHRPDVGRRPRGRGGAPPRQEGLPLDQLPRDAARPGLPELPVRPLGPDAAGAVRREHGAVAAHRRRRSTSSSAPPEAPIDHLIVLACQITVHHRAGPAVRADAAAVPRPQGRAVRGRHRLDPVLPRPRRPPLPEPGVAARQRLRRASCRPTCSASTSSPATSPTRRACSCATGSASTSSPGSATTPTPTRRGPSRPSSPGRSSRTPACTRRRDPQDHVGERVPLLRLGPVRAHAEGAGDGRRAARARPPTSTSPACRAPSGSKRNEAAGIGVF